MYCEMCGAPLEPNDLVCTTCGAAPEGSRLAAQPARPSVPEEAPAGPTCARHEGIPLLGDCPRCHRPVCYRCAPGADRDELTCAECFGLSPAHAQPPRGAKCALHPTSRALFVCARCGSFACVECKPEFPTPGHCVRCARPEAVLATRGSRFVANLVDNLVVAIVPIVGIAVLTAIGHGLSAPPEFALVGSLFAMALGLGAQLWAQLTWGQSIGKRMLKIKVVRSDGSPIELWRLLVLRNLAIQAISQFCSLVGLVDALFIFGNEQRCLHDYLADSMVVQVTPDGAG